MIVTKQELSEKIKISEQDSHAAYEIGEYYYVQGDYSQAVSWYEKAATSLNPDPMAFYALGYASQMGEGTAVDLIEALHCYEFAAEKDIPQACYNLAYFYQNGIAVNRNQKLADRYSERASECLKKQAEELQTTKAALLQIQDDYRKIICSYKKKTDEIKHLRQIQNKLKKDMEAQKVQYNNLLKAHMETSKMPDNQTCASEGMGNEAEKQKKPQQNGQKAEQKNFPKNTEKVKTEAKEWEKLYQQEKQQKVFFMEEAEKSKSEAERWEKLYQQEKQQRVFLMAEAERWKELFYGGN